MKYPDDFINEIIYGDCIEVMKIMPDNCIDTIITDPPYNLSTIKRFKAKDSGEKWNVKSGVFHRTSKGFMGQEWDNEIAFQIETWEAVYRISKPGTTLLCFGGTRTYHRLACAIEDAGWIIKDTIMWLYGSGFPKATDISKQIDKKPNTDLNKFSKALKKRREELGLSISDADKLITGGTTMYSFLEGRKDKPLYPPNREYWKNIKKHFGMDGWEQIVENNLKVVRNEDGNFGYQKDGERWLSKREITETTSMKATLWNGWKSHGLKPAYEPILICMKPNEGSYANNALKWGVAGLNIDGGRIRFEEGGTVASNPKLRVERGCKTETGDRIFCQGELGKKNTMVENVKKGGRYPANVILDEEAGRLLKQQTGEDVGRFFKQVDITIQELAEFNISDISRFIGKDRKTIRNKLKEIGLYKNPTKYIENDDEERVCEICEVLKPIDDFVKWRSGKWCGHRHICKECWNKKCLPKTKEELERSKAVKLAYYHNTRKQNRKENKITKEDVLAIKSIGKCFYCGATNTEFQIDHIIPVAKGGKTEIINLVLSCAKCNRSKNDRNLEEWYKEQPFFNENKLRMVYTPKASKAERNRGCEGLEEKYNDDSRKDKNAIGCNNPRNRSGTPKKNSHPTVKPLALMKYLCTLTKTPTGGIVLDPFCGSGTTLIACKELKRDYIGIDNNPEYCEIAKKRVNAVPEPLF